ncbi:hypothetical protein [Streptomyces longisporoflavus]|uniref:STAS domain-containing protein n=1 Tax=Streptomyces longisporoflavus TaxID=28044 RepID=A0ABW7QQR7_9ACTN
MRGYFADEVLLMLPLPTSPGVRLRGEVLGSHRGPLALALTDEAARTDEIILDLTDVHYVSNSVLQTLALLACRLSPPQCLIVKAGSELGLRARTAAYGWERIATLRLMET